MIMLLTHQQELRIQLSTSLQADGHSIAIPHHREDMVTVLNTSKPDLVVLDLYMDHPSGIEDLKILRDEGYQGRIIVLSDPSMMPILKEIYPSGIESVVQGPAKINGQYHLGNLQSAISSGQHSAISRRAYALYESGGRHDGRDLHDWLRAERESERR
jgi:CheY-like chemotaxis protein